MMSSPDERRAVQQAADLERPLLQVEDCLVELGLALHRQDSQALDRVAAELHTALAAAVDHFGRAARAGGVPPVLRQRLALASGQVAAQREALARATASLDRAIDVLLPRQTPAGVYSVSGTTDRLAGHGGSLLA
jgi:ABC-type transporter Mla subunit MlaD